MSNWPISGKVNQLESSGAFTASSLGTNVNVTSFVEIIASTSFDYDGFFLCFQALDNRPSKHRWDVAVGPSGSEIVIVSEISLDVPASNQAFNAGGYSFLLPVSIASGSRVSIRSARTSNIGLAVVIGYAGGFNGITGIGKIINVGTLGGVSIDPGGSANTKGAWTQVDSSVVADIEGMYVSFDTRLNTAMAAAVWLFDIAIGPSGSEVILFENIPLGSNTSEVLSPRIMSIPNTFIASGTRLSVRSQCSITNSSDRLFGVNFHCFIQ